MRRAAVVALALSVAACAGKQPVPRTALTVDEQLRRAETLGRALLEYDSLSAAATDLLFQKVGPVPDPRVGGYVTVVAERRVEFVAEAGADVRRYYSVELSGAEPKVSHFDGAVISGPEAAMFRAIRSASQKFEPLCDAAYNTAVLPDPDGKGWLVYFLVATTRDRAVPIGGHVRVKVSEDGRTVVEVTPLSRSCLVLQKAQDAAALWATHQLSATPVETHVFANLLYDVPLFIGTSDGNWSIDHGKITRAGQ